MGRLDGKTALITGAGAGIGKEAALLFATEGARIAVADRVPDVGNRTVSLIRDAGGQAIFILGDTSKASDAERMARETVETYGGLDILFNNAGIRATKRAIVGDADEEVWNETMAINITGVFLCSKYAVREMVKRGSGSIINAASIMGVIGFPTNSAYIASKGAVISFTKTMALEYADKNIRVNCICPGWIDTAMLREIGEKNIKWVENQVPMRRIGTPKEIAQSALYLASDESSYVTGISLIIDGGWTAK